MAVESETGKNMKKDGGRRGDGALLPRAQARDATAALLAWYDGHARTLPWRIGPHDEARPDPYKVWLSEIMLQQTTVAAVKQYFIKFTEIWPTIFDLARADDAAVMAAWAGLGYYARARNLHACAKAVVERYGGQFPDTEAELRDLPGIGAYTSAAIAAIAFGRRAVVVDANVERVAARLAAITEPLPAAKPLIHDVVDAMTPSEASGKSGDFAQAMMDLGAMICTVKAPKCLLCPLAKSCAAHRAGIAEQLPRKAPKKARPVRHGWAWWVEQDGHILFERRPAKGLLGAMPGLPGSAWVEGDTPPALPPDATDLEQSVQHVFTHFALNLRLARRDARAIADEMPIDPLWVKIDKLDELPLPTLYKKAIKVMKNGKSA